MSYKDRGPVSKGVCPMPIPPKDHSNKSRRPPDSRTRDIKTSERPRHPSTHEPKIPTYSPGFDDNDDDSDADVCPPPSINCTPTFTIYQYSCVCPPAPPTQESNMHEPPPKSAKNHSNKSKRRPGPRSAHGKKRDPSPPGSPMHESNIPTYPPAFDDDDDSDSDFAVCPPPSTGCPTMITICQCPYPSGPPYC